MGGAHGIMHFATQDKQEEQRKIQCDMQKMPMCVVLCEEDTTCATILHKEPESMGLDMVA